jgi:hypothetical protein
MLAHLRDWCRAVVVDGGRTDCSGAAAAAAGTAEWGSLESGFAGERRWSAGLLDQGSLRSRVVGVEAEAEAGFGASVGGWRVVPGDSGLHRSELEGRVHRTSAHVEPDNWEGVARVAVDMAADMTARRVERLAGYTGMGSVGVHKAELGQVPQKQALPSSPFV